MKPKIKIDAETGILSIKVSSKKSVDSEVKGNVVVDFDEKGDITKIEIMNFSLEDFDRKLDFLKMFPNLTFLEKKKTRV